MTLLLGRRMNTFMDLGEPPKVGWPLATLTDSMHLVGSFTFAGFFVLKIIGTLLSKGPQNQKLWLLMFWPAYTSWPFGLKDSDLGVFHCFGCVSEKPAASGVLATRDVMAEFFWEISGRLDRQFSFWQFGGQLHRSKCDQQKASTIWMSGGPSRTTGSSFL